MDQVYLVVAVVCLVASWIYILVLKARIRDCVRYIQHRIDQANPGLAGADGSPDKGHESKETGNPSPLPSNSPTPSLMVEATTGGKPKLIVASPDLHRPFHYLCSHCAQTFTLPAEQSLKEAVVELVLRYTQHLEDHHPNIPQGQVWTQ